MNSRQTDTLQVSDLALQIEGPAVWIEAFKKMWPGWMGSSQAAPWAVDMSTGPACEPTGSPFAPEMRFSDGACRWSAPGFAGVIHPSQARAHLEAPAGASAGDLAMFVRTCLALQAFEQGSLLFHAAGVVRRGQGYALFGLSGSGKTTAARFSRGDAILNDDLILLKPAKAGWQVWPTPFGRGRFPQVYPAPLRALLRLVQDQEDRLEMLGPGVALGELVANSPVVNAHAAWVPALLTRWQAVLSQVPVRALHLRRGPAFWEVVDAEFG